MTKYVTTTKYVTINLTNNADPSLAELVALRKELQEQFHGVTCAIKSKVVENHPEFLKINWELLNR